MPLADAYGNTLSTTQTTARDQYDRGVRCFLASDFAAAEAFEAATQADPGFTLGHVGHARALMMQGAMPQAKAAMARASTLTGSLTQREQAHLAIFQAVFDGNAQSIRPVIREHVNDHPRDALVAQLCSSVFGLIGFSGKTGREAELLAYTGALLPHYGDDWWMMSMHAISLCETGQIAESRALMERALALNPRNANGAHFHAHVLYEAGETKSGRQYLGDWITGYDKRAVLHGHLSWHLALWALQDGDHDEMWSAIDSGIRPDRSHSLPINALTDMAAILYRAEIAGVDVPRTYWTEISAYAARFFPTTGQSFVDMHAALCHAMAGDGDRLAVIAETATGFAGDLVRPVAKAWGDMARGNWTAALAHLSPVMASTERFGGSRAQRDLIELAYVNVLMKLGCDQEARRTLRMRRPVLSLSPPVHAMSSS